MNLTYQTWPFSSVQTLPPDQQERWWQECFVLTPAVQRFVTIPHSAAIVGGPGSGKSTALAFLKREIGQRVLLLDYLPQRWPGGGHPLAPGHGHLAQMMGLTADALLKQWQARPDSFPHLDEWQRDFLYWLVEKHLGRKALVLLARHLQQKADLTLDVPQSAPDLYALDSQQTAEVRGQISELVDLSQALGYSQIAFLIDLNQMEAARLVDDLGLLFGWLDLMENPGFTLRAALPEDSVRQAHIAERSGGRVTLIGLNYTEAEARQIAEQCLGLATEGQTSSLLTLANEELLARVGREVEMLYGEPAVAGWLHWTDTLLRQFATQPGGTPLTETKKLVADYYRRHVPLRLEPDTQYVWRGPQRLSLDRQPFEALKKLHDLRGQRGFETTRALLEIAGTPSNLNTLMSRVRQAVEPVKGEEIYVSNSRDLGYWLENSI